MIKLTDHQKALLQAVISGRTLQRRRITLRDSTFEDAENLVYFFDPECEWRVKTDPVEALARFAASAWQDSFGDDFDAQDDDAAWQDMIRALAKKCPALLEVEL